MLFIDFSSTFNTIIPQKLGVNLSGLGLNTTLCSWVLDFLTERPQSVGCSTITLSTGAPQGCVLSPMLFTLLTQDCTAMYSTNHNIKFADDMTVVDRQIIVYFRKTHPARTPVSINGSAVEIVRSTKFLSVHIT